MDNRSPFNSPMCSEKIRSSKPLVDSMNSWKTGWRRFFGAWKWWKGNVLYVYNYTPENSHDNETTPFLIGYRHLQAVVFPASHVSFWGCSYNSYNSCLEPKWTWLYLSYLNVQGHCFCSGLKPRNLEDAFTGCRYSTDVWKNSDKKVSSKQFPAIW